MDNERKYLYDALTERLGGKLEEDTLVMPGGFGIKTWFDQIQEKQGIKMIVAVFTVYHKDFDEPIIEPVEVQGKTLKEAADTAVEIFHAVLWRTIEQAEKHSEPVHIPVELFGEHYDFDMYCKSLVRIGVDTDREPVSLVKFIMDEIPKYLGTKKYYWLRMYLAKDKEQSKIEIRLNGSVCVELPAYFEDFVAEEMDGSEHVECEKMYALFVQREDDKCPFSKELVMDIAAETIERMADIRDAEDYEGMVKKSQLMAGDNKYLADEIRALIPEIFAKLTLGTREGDSLFLIGEDGESVTEFKKSQLRSYFYIQQAVLMYFKTKPDKEKVGNIVTNSASYRAFRRAMDKAKEEGNDIKPEDLYVPGIRYRIGSGDYRVW